MVWGRVLVEKGSLSRVQFDSIDAQCARRESHQTHGVGSIALWCCPIPWYQPRWIA